MNFLQTLLNIGKDVGLGHAGQTAGHALAQAHPQPAPDVTYNPNPQTNIPYSVHSPQQPQAMANPMLMHPSQSPGVPMGPQSPLGAPLPPFTLQNMAQGSQFNPGLTRMQGSVGYGTTPQMGAYAGDFANQGNPGFPMQGNYYDQ